MTDTSEASGSDGASAKGAMAGAISTGVVRVTREFIGRGPTKARTYISDELVTVVLHDALTKAERRLVEEGRDDTVLDARQVFQQMMRDDLVELVEGATGQRVVAFMSANHTDPDVAIESFVLEPQGR